VIRITLKKKWERFKDGKVAEKRVHTIKVVVKECPTRKFVVGADIYTFTFILCQEKKCLL